MAFSGVKCLALLFKSTFPKIFFWNPWPWKFLGKFVTQKFNFSRILGDAINFLKMKDHYLVWISYFNDNTNLGLFEFPLAEPLIFLWYWLGGNFNLRTSISYRSSLSSFACSRNGSVLFNRAISKIVVKCLTDSSSCGPICLLTIILHTMYKIIESMNMICLFEYVQN